MSANDFFIAMNVKPALIIRLERIRRGWRQIDLAEKAGVTQAEVSAAERGQYIVPAARRRIEHVLDLKSEDE